MFPTYTLVITSPSGFTWSHFIEAPTEAKDEGGEVLAGRRRLPWLFWQLAEGSRWDGAQIKLWVGDVQRNPPFLGCSDDNFVAVWPFPS